MMAAFQGALSPAIYAGICATHNAAISPANCATGKPVLTADSSRPA